jgi:hypothetical protein
MRAASSAARVRIALSKCGTSCSTTARSLAQKLPALRGRLTRSLA